MINSRKVPPACFKCSFRKLFRNASKFWICFRGNSMSAGTGYKVFKIFNDLNPNFAKNNFLSFLKFNWQKR